MAAERCLKKVVTPLNGSVKKIRPRFSFFRILDEIVKTKGLEFL